MPRKPRIQSQTDTYHVMMRGSNKQQVFYDTEDREYFLRILQKVKNDLPFELYAYCLMGNHIHFLLHANPQVLSDIFRRVGASFVYWYNLKYERIGHLFQGRFRSEIIEEEAVFLAVLRYIVRNPVAAGICKTPEDYPYSSMREYMGLQKGITDTGLALSLLNRADLIAFCQHDSSDRFLDMSPATTRPSDDKALALIQEEFGPQIELPENREQLGSAVSHLLASGLSIRQISRLSGISKGFIERSQRWDNHNGCI